MKQRLKHLLFVWPGKQRVRLFADYLRLLKTLLLRICRNKKKSSGFGETVRKIQKFGDARHHVFFGYYDFSPVNSDHTILLANRTSVRYSTCQEKNYLEIGFYDCLNGTGGFYPVARTLTWCWQQGCRLQWYPLSDKGWNKTVIYNTLVDGSYGSRIQNIYTKKIKHQYRQPIYAISPNGKYGFTLNFSRLGRLRPGYGYTLCSDKTSLLSAPENDGIWRLNMDTGDIRLLVSLSEISNFHPAESMENAVHYFNHISVNPANNRMLFFHVWISRGKRRTRLITADMDGSNLTPLINDGLVSHYTWKSSDEILCYSSHYQSELHYHLYKDRTSLKTKFAPDLLTADGHPSYSSDERYVLTDTYPDQHGERKLLLYDVIDNKLIQLAALYSPFQYRGEKRCDLHPRWGSNGNSIIIDSAHEGFRAMYMLEVSLAENR